MINIYLNGEIYSIEPTYSLNELLLENDHTEEHFAVAINNQFIPRKVYCTTQLNPGDRVDIIVPMQGG